MTTTKKMLVSHVARDTKCQSNLASKAVDSIFKYMCHSLIKGNRIEIRGFGVFTVKAAKAKPSARNPRTGEPVFVPARRKTHFKPGKILRTGLQQPIKEK